MSRPSSPAESERLFPGLRDYLRKRFGDDAAGASIEPLGTTPGGIKQGGYGVPHRIRWKSPFGEKTLVLETVRPGPFGHEESPDRAAILLRAHRDYGRLEGHVAAVDVAAFRAGGAVSLGDAGEFFLLTEFVEGEPYACDFDRIASAGALRALDRQRAQALVDYLVRIHREPAAQPGWYARRLRELVGSGECIAGIADSYPVPCGFIDADLLREVEELALRWRYRLKGLSTRLRSVHGDFHPWNILFREGSDFSVLDRSRGAWGDPADDVASLVANYLFFALRTAGGFSGPFAELFREFWQRYRAGSGDAHLEEVVAPHFAFRALVLANPLWYPAETEALRRLLFRFIFSVLEADRFEVDRIPEYLHRDRP
jgi:aminoglycoside phosphotransferase (APT) family kinase protein